MSKLYSNYLKLKKDNPDTLYLFKSGIFYIGIDKDAERLSELFGFKLINLNEDVMKCGFPSRSLEVYINQLKNSGVPFEIIDSNCPKVTNCSDYLNDVKLRQIVQTILNLDMNNLTFREAFELLQKFKDDLNKICG